MSQYRSPTYTEYPSPLRANGSGWTWTSQRLVTSAKAATGGRLPRISVVTPSYNQAQFIEETVRSVLLQGYPNLEYIIVDGGSTDGSVEVIRKYEPWLAYWVSEPDNGQSHAINKGWSIATGDLVAWINSDDRYEEGALHAIGQAYAQSPELDLIYGDCRLVSADGAALDLFIGDYHYHNLLEFWRTGVYYGIAQQTAFFSRRLVERIGPLAEDLHYLMDYEYFLRAGPDIRTHSTNRILASYRLHENSKSISQVAGFAREFATVADRHPDKFSRDTRKTFLDGVNCRYAEMLIGSALQNASSDRRAARTAIRQALSLCPRLARNGWIQRLLLKVLVGTPTYAKIRSLVRG